MYHLIKNSLAYHKARPLIVPRNMSGMRVGDMSLQINKYMEASPGLVRPETEAVKFYLLNDAFAKLCLRFDQHEPLPPDVDGVAGLYISEGQAIALRAIYYTLMIITREARHLHNGQYKSSMASLHGKVFSDFMYSINSTGEDEAVNKLRHSPPDMGIADFASCIAHTFEHGGWGSSYGGKPWANIATTLARMLKGETSIETFVDTVWTLCHNGGPIFNKGMLYSHYDQQALTKILDVQRAGMIPQLVNEGGVGYSDGALTALYQTCRSVVGDDFGGYVDWFEVEKLGAVNTYPIEKKKQLAKHGKPKSVVSLDAGKFYVMPGVAAKITPRKKAA